MALFLSFFYLGTCRAQALVVAKGRGKKVAAKPAPLSEVAEASEGGAAAEHAELGDTASGEEGWSDGDHDGPPDDEDGDEDVDGRSPPEKKRRGVSCLKCLKTPEDFLLVTSVSDCSVTFRGHRATARITARNHWGGCGGFTNSVDAPPHQISHNVSARAAIRDFAT